MRSKLKKFIPFSLGKRLRGAWQIFQSFIFYGNRFECPFCKHSFWRFLYGGFDLPVIKEKNIIGSGRRKNCVCPRCYSTDRDRLLYHYFKNYSDILSNPLRVLHIAPSGALKSLLSAQTNLKYKQGVKYHEGFYYSKDISIIDITDLSFEDNSFDVIICNHVLEHIIDDQKAMRELYRILKPGGWAILQVPISFGLKKTYENPDITDPKGRELHFGQFDHVRIYGNDYTERLKNAEFEVNVVQPYRDWKEISSLDKLAVNKEEHLFIVTK